MSDRDKDPVVDEVTEPASGGAPDKPKRTRRSKSKTEAEKNAAVRRATKAMIAEGGPVGDEDERQLGVNIETLSEENNEATTSGKPLEDIAGDIAARPPTPANSINGSPGQAMVSEGGPVGDELDRQQGITDLPEETIEAETPLIEKAHPELTGTTITVERQASRDKPKTTARARSAQNVRRTEPVSIAPAPSSEPLAPGSGNPSPDGSQLAYLLTDAEGSTRLWISALDGSSASSIELPFQPIFDPEGPQWSPDGQWIALTGSAPSEIGTAIWLAPVDGGNCVLLADHAASDEQPRWSPDGSLLAFASHRHGRSAICVATPDGYGPVVQLTDAPLGQDDRNPCWEPSSQRIAYTRHMVDGENEGEQIWTVSILTGEQKQATKKLAHRSQLQWCPGKSQIAFITDEAEWLNVGVVNPDNSAGWNLASEAGDKSFPRYSPDGQRIMYIRRIRGEVRLVERPTSGASAEPLDPGAGVATAPSWLPEKHIVYQFSPATGAPSFIVQEAKKEVERFYIPVTGDWTAQDWFVAPEQVEYEIAGGLKSGVLVYRHKGERKQPAIILLGAEPHHGNTYHFDATIQVLARDGYTVIVPTLPGTPGYGKKIVKALRERAGTEAEIADLVDLADWVRDLDYVDKSRIYLVGQGYGGALALLLPGARPGSVDAVAVIDPVTDWDDELDQSDDDFAHWYLQSMGLPSANRGKSALRTPTTFAGVLDLPVLLIGTSRASLGRSVQLERFVSILDELDVPYFRQTAERESIADTAARVSNFLEAPAKPETIAKPAEAAPGPESDYVIEAVETVDIESLLVGNDNGDRHDEIQNTVAEQTASVIETPAIAKTESVEREANGAPAGAIIEPRSAEPDPEDRIIPPPPSPGSSNVGRGMRTDEI